MSTKQNAGLVVADFDGTMADTFAPSPNGLDVNEACRQVLGEMFGMPNALEQIGGLQNRAPRELVGAALKVFPSRWQVADTFLARHCPAGRGFFGDLLAEAFVRRKLDLLLDEIGEHEDGMWPAPCDGVVSFLRAREVRGTHYAIISSGHDLFIEKCLDLWGAPRPIAMVTDDDLRALPWPPHEKVKPSGRLFELLFDRFGAAGIAIPPRERIVYIGDDPIKDGGLAVNASVRFGWYNPNGHRHEFPSGSKVFSFSSWRELTSELTG